MPPSGEPRPPARQQSPVTKQPVATIGQNGMPVPTKAPAPGGAPTGAGAPPMAGPGGGPMAGAVSAGRSAIPGSAAVGEATSAPKAARGKIRTANLVHRPAPTGVRVGVGAVVLILLVIIPGILVLRAGGTNPAVDQLNALKLPSWSAQHPVDHASGSRWCFGSCMITERTWDSDRPVDETAAAYEAALREAGWSPAGQCPKFPGGVQTCWVLDQNELDLTVGKSPCALGTPPENRTSADAVPTEPGKLPAGCAQTSVHAKVTDQSNVARS